MCIIISYGFTENGSQSGGSCTALLSSTIGAFVSITVEAADVGKILTARINLRINDISKGEFNSVEFTPTNTGLHTFDIPFTGVPTQVGIYTFGYGGPGCAYIYYSTNLGSYVCYACSSTRCTTLTVSVPPPVCPTPAVTLTIPS